MFLIAFVCVYNINTDLNRITLPLKKKKAASLLSENRLYAVNQRTGYLNCQPSNSNSPAKTKNKSCLPLTGLVNCAVTSLN